MGKAINKSVPGLPTEGAVAILGPTGAGKTTLARILGGQFKQLRCLETNCARDHIYGAIFSNDPYLVQTGWAESINEFQYSHEPEVYHDLLLLENPDTHKEIPLPVGLPQILTKKHLVIVTAHQFRHLPDWAQSLATLRIYAWMPEPTLVRGIVINNGGRGLAVAWDVPDDIPRPSHHKV